MGKKNIGPSESPTETNLHALISNHEMVFLKMDIEGAEVDWLHSLNESHLNKLAQIVIEFHSPIESDQNGRASQTCQYALPLSCAQQQLRQSTIFYEWRNNVGCI
jgi:hypothetical protein